jgi:putative ABC transport system permease protein
MPLLQDIQFGVRLLRKQPGFTVLAVLALAIGIGANTAIYSVAEALLYQPLLLPDLDRAVYIRGTLRGGSQNESLSPADYLDIRRQSKTMDSIAAFTNASLTETGQGDPVRLEGTRVTPGFFSTLAARPELGRVFLPEEEQSGQARVIVLSHPFWISQFGGDPNIVGREMVLDGEAYHVVGVMQKEMRYPPDSQFWIPLTFRAALESERRARYLPAVARLKPGMSLRQATAELQAITAQLERDYPTTNARASARAMLLREVISGDLTPGYIQMLMGAVLFVLLIACSNVANLQFSRISLRSREIAVRTAVGGSRGRILGQLMTESVLLALAGAIAGILFAIWSLDLIKAGMNPEVQRFLPGWERIGLNASALVLTTVIAVAAGIISGVGPAWIGSRSDLGHALKEGAQGAGTGSGRVRLRGALVVVQIVLALVLTAGAGLLSKGMSRVNEPRPGMQPEMALVFNIALPEKLYGTPAAITDFHTRMLSSIGGLPGMESAAVVTSIPYSGSSRGTDFTIEGRPPEHASEQPNAQRQSVSRNYFRTAHIPMIAGREFTDNDGPAAPGVVIIGERLARRYFPGEDPIGRRIKLARSELDRPFLTIVGIAADILHNPFERFPRYTVYRPYAQQPDRSMGYFLRASAEPLALSGGVRARLEEIDSSQPIAAMMTFRKVINDQLLGYRYVMVMMAICGVIALLLSAIGVYGVMAYSVTERSREIGLRMALGAEGGDVLRMVGGWGLRLTILGLVFGVPAALLLARLLSGLLYGVESFDISIFSVSVLVMTAAAGAASFVPVRRAVKLDPMVTLRTE